MRTDSTVTVDRPQTVRTGPKFFDHEELRGRWAEDRLFGQAFGSGSETIGREGDLIRFKQMHFCARRLNALRRRYDKAAPTGREWQRLASRHRELRNQIAANNLGLVYHVLRRKAIRNADGDELLSAGMLALTRAIDSFNPWRGIRFSTYAYHAIARAFSRCHAQEANRLPRECGHFETYMEGTDWIDARRAEEVALWSERLSVILAENRAGLTAIEKNVLSQRFPVDPDMPRRTLSDFGREVGLSKARVRQLEASAIQKLRVALKVDPLLQ